MLLLVEIEDEVEEIRQTPNQYSPGVSDPANGSGIIFCDCQNEDRLPGKAEPMENEVPPTAEVEVAAEALAVVLLLVFVYPGAQVVQELAPLMDCPEVMLGKVIETDIEDSPETDKD